MNVRKNGEHKSKIAPEVDGDYFCKKVSENIRRLRIAHEMSQEQLGNEMEVSKQFIQKIENGQRNISIKTLLKLAVHLNTTPSELINVL